MDNSKSVAAKKSRRETKKFWKAAHRRKAGLLPKITEWLKATGALLFVLKHLIDVFRHVN